MSKITKTFATGKVSQRTGREGPAHDPYGFMEYIWERSGHCYTLHLGLADWLQVDSGAIRYDCHDQASCTQEFERLTGVSVSTIERAMQHQKPCCGRPNIDSVEGYPGETLYLCRSCNKIIGSSFDESAVI